MGIVFPFVATAKVPMTKKNEPKEVQNLSIQSSYELLFISSYMTDYSCVQKTIDGFETTYEQLHGKYSISIESMDCSSLNEVVDWQKRMDTILRKHSNPRGVVLLGLQACITYLSETDPKWKNIPVYCALSPRYVASLDAGCGIKSVAEKDIDDRGTVDLFYLMKGFNVRFGSFYEYGIREDFFLMEKFFPDFKNVTILSDNSYEGLTYLRQVKDYLKIRPDIYYHSIDGRYYDMEEAIEQYKKMSAQSILLLCAWTYDKNYTIYMNNAMNTFRKTNPDIPIFSLASSGIGTCAIGGYVPLYRDYEEGVDIAKRIYRELELKENVAIDIHTLDKVYMFDENELQKYGIEKELLPHGSIVLNQKPTTIDLLHRYKWQLIAFVSIFFLLMVGLIISLMYSAHIRRLTENIEKQNNLLKKERDELEISQHQLRIAKERAEEANQMKTNFVSNMSHEIRTPLNAITGFSNLLADSVSDNPELKEYVKIITDNSDMLLRLINDILDISRLESGKSQFVYETVDIVPYCKGVINTIAQTAEKGVELRLKCEESKVVVKTDITRLQQVLINLLNNAVKYTHEGYIELWIEKNVKNNELRIIVSDTGVGIPKNKQNIIFERFEKVNEYVQGTGLGLSICQMTLNKMGGKIRVDNDYIQGARFICTIPLTK